MIFQQSSTELKRISEVLKGTLLGGNAILGFPSIFTSNVLLYLFSSDYQKSFH